MNRRLTYTALTFLRKIMEPAGGLEHSISRIQFGRSNVKLHRHKVCVKRPSNLFKDLTVLPSQIRLLCKCGKTSLIAGALPTAVAKANQST